jgi:hypothetical protein
MKGPVTNELPGAGNIEDHAGKALL